MCKRFTACGIGDNIILLFKITQTSNKFMDSVCDILYMYLTDREQRVTGAKYYQPRGSSGQFFL